MKKIYLVCLLGGVVLSSVTACNSIDEKILTERRKGIVDACYTSLEYNQAEKIDTYLAQKIQRKQITKGEGEVIKDCIDRTVSSTQWKGSKSK